MKKILILGLLMTSMTFATVKNSTIVYTIEGNAEDAYNKMMGKPLKDLGYRVPDPKKNVNGHYSKKFGTTHLDLLTFSPVINNDEIRPLLEMEPKLSGFSPFNVVAYKKKGQNKTVISHLTPEVVFEILDITDRKVMSGYRKMVSKLDKLITKTFPNAKVSHQSYSGDLSNMMNYFELEFDRPDDIEDFTEEIQEEVEDTFIKKGYMMAGFFDYKQAKVEMLPSYDAFWSFTLCHFLYSYTVFDNKRAMPEVAVFAPCAMYMYIKKDSNKLVVGMPKLGNWNKIFKKNSKARNDFLNKLSHEIPAIYKEIGFTHIK